MTDPILQRPSFSVYDASAGSGKTYALVKEYLKIILCAKQNDAYRNILAITFTNKAVHEMKSRIIGNLSEFARETPAVKAVELIDVLSCETGMSASAIKEKSAQIIKHIIHNYAAFDISTIDKFTHKVIRAFARDLNLPMSFEVSLDTDSLLSEAVDLIISRAGEDKILTKLLVDFTMEKTDDDKSWDISREIFETGKLILNENNRNEIQHFAGHSIPEFLTIKHRLRELCVSLDDECVTLAAKAKQIISDNGINPASFAGKYFPNHIDCIFRNQLARSQKKYHSPDDVRINKTATDRQIIESVLPELLHILETIYSKYEKRDFYRAFLKNITPLSLLNTISQKLAEIQQEQNLLSISEFNALIHREIQNQPAPFIYERLGERYRHFFIDEFQDTSEMQWQNLIPLIDNATSSMVNDEKGTLMIVGDPKQSIYRWRGGKAEQFIDLAKGNHPFNNKEIKLISLDTNWRSYSQIIEFNNDFFGGLSEEFEPGDYQDLYANHCYQKINNKKGGYVNIKLLPKTTADAEVDMADRNELHLQATFEAVQNALTQGFSYREIAILTRKRGQGIAVANYLAERDIPLLSSETLMLQNSEEVRFILFVLKYLRNNQDQEAKAMLLHFMAKKQNLIPVHDFIEMGLRLKQEHEFERMFDGMSIVFQDVRRKSLYEAVEIIISMLIRPTTSNAYLQYFLDIVLEREVRNQAGISDFIEYWEKNAEKFSIPSPEGKEAVRILTIHKSKGLEFPIVIMPFAEEDYNRKPKDKLWIDATEETVGLTKVLIDNSSAIESFGQAAASVYQLRKQEELLDNINVLYVALTRAEEQLHIISGMNLTNKGEICENNMSAFFIKFLERKHLFDPQRLEYEFGTPVKVSDPMVKKPLPAVIENVSAPLQMSSIKIAQRESLMWGTTQQKSIEYGNVVHEILAYVKTSDDVARAVTVALENGIISSSQEQEVRNTLIQIVSHPELLQHFAVGNRVMNEQVIIQKNGPIIKPDRIVLAGNREVLLLDYKTGAPQQKYIQQLQSYQDGIEQMGYRVTKKALVYIGEQVNVVNL